MVGIAIFEYDELRLPRNIGCVLLLLGHMAATSGAHLCLLFALSTIRPIITSIVRSLTVVIFFVSQYTIMSDINHGKSNYVEVTGAVLVIVGGALKPVFEHFKHFCQVDQ